MGGIVVHVGSSLRVGHYYAITCCWETGKAYKLNDAQFPKTLQDNELDEEIKNAYMLVFSKTNEEADVLSDTTIEDPRSPARKKNRQEEEQEEELTSEESDFIQLVKDIEQITLIPPKERTEDQKKKLRNMKSKHKKLEKDFQHLDTLLKQKPKTAAEKKAAYRQKQTAETREKVRAADRARMAALTSSIVS